MARYVVGIDMGGDKVRVCVGDDGGRLHGIKSEKVDFSSANARTIEGKNESVTEQIFRMIEESAEDVRRKQEEQVPLKRGWWYENVAGMVLFLASDKSSYIAGQASGITGGEVMS